MRSIGNRLNDMRTSISHKSHSASTDNCNVQTDLSTLTDDELRQIQVVLEKQKEHHRHLTNTQSTLLHDIHETRERLFSESNFLSHPKLPNRLRTISNDWFRNSDKNVIDEEKCSSCLKSFHRLSLTKCAKCQQSICNKCSSNSRISSSYFPSTIQFDIKDGFNRLSQYIGLNQQSSDRSIDGKKDENGGSNSRLTSFNLNNERDQSSPTKEQEKLFCRKCLEEMNRLITYDQQLSIDSSESLETIYSEKNSIGSDSSIPSLTEEKRPNELSVVTPTTNYSNNSNNVNPTKTPNIIIQRSWKRGTLNSIIHTTNKMMFDHNYTTSTDSSQSTDSMSSYDLKRSDNSEQSIKNRRSRINRARKQCSNRLSIRTNQYNTSDSPASDCGNRTQLPSTTNMNMIGNSRRYLNPKRKSGRNAFVMQCSVDYPSIMRTVTDVREVAKSNVFSRLCNKRLHERKPFHYPSVSHSSLVQRKSQQDYGFDPEPIKDERKKITRSRPKILRSSYRRKTLNDLQQIQTPTESNTWTIPRRVNRIVNPHKVILSRTAEDKSCRTYGLGMRVVGGIQCATDELGVFIASVVAGGPGDVHGEIEMNDRLLEINGHSLKDSTFEEVKVLLEQAGHIVQLSVVHSSSSLKRVIVPKKFEKLNSSIPHHFSNYNNSKNNNYIMRKRDNIKHLARDNRSLSNTVLFVPQILENDSEYLFGDQSTSAKDSFRRLSVSNKKKFYLCEGRGSATLASTLSSLASKKKRRYLPPLPRINTLKNKTEDLKKIKLRNHDYDDDDADIEDNADNEINNVMHVANNSGEKETKLIVLNNYENHQSLTSIDKLSTNENYSLIHHSDNKKSDDDDNNNKINSNNHLSHINPFQQSPQLRYSQNQPVQLSSARSSVHYVNKGRLLMQTWYNRTTQTLALTVVQGADFLFPTDEIPFLFIYGKIIFNKNRSDIFQTKMLQSKKPFWNEIFIFKQVESVDTCKIEIYLRLVERRISIKPINKIDHITSSSHLPKTLKYENRKEEKKNWNEARSISNVIQSDIVRVIKFDLADANLRDEPRWYEFHDSGEHGTSLSSNDCSLDRTDNEKRDCSVDTSVESETNERSDSSFASPLRKNNPDMNVLLSSSDQLTSSEKKKKKNKRKYFNLNLKKVRESFYGPKLRKSMKLIMKEDTISVKVKMFENLEKGTPMTEECLRRLLKNYEELIAPPSTPLHYVTNKDYITGFDEQLLQEKLKNLEDDKSNRRRLSIGSTTKELHELKMVAAMVDVSHTTTHLVPPQPKISTRFLKQKLRNENQIVPAPQDSEIIKIKTNDECASSLISLSTQQQQQQQCIVDNKKRFNMSHCSLLSHCTNSLLRPTNICRIIDRAHRSLSANRHYKRFKKKDNNSPLPTDIDVNMEIIPKNTSIQNLAASQLVPQNNPITIAIHQPSSISGTSSDSQHKITQYKLSTSLSPIVTVVPPTKSPTAISNCELLMDEILFTSYKNRKESLFTYSSYYSNSKVQTLKNYPNELQRYRSKSAILHSDMRSLVESLKSVEAISTGKPSTVESVEQNIPKNKSISFTNLTRISQVLQDTFRPATATNDVELKANRKSNESNLTQQEDDLDRYFVPYSKLKKPSIPESECGIGQVINEKCVDCNYRGLIKIGLLLTKGQLKIRIIEAKRIRIPSTAKITNDFYVKGYLCDEKRTSHKRKTITIKNSTHPFFYTTFSYNGNVIVNHKLQISLWMKTSRLDKNVNVGEVFIDLDKLDLVTLPNINWYTLWSPKLIYAFSTDIIAIQSNNY
ncbi:hypothetical protein SNEBB_003239 [Seison nebaliae]|nr:hypothetical protein SNEBB_003239 [Seison nebaliae]